MGSSDLPPFPAPEGKCWVFCMSFRHWRSGEQVYRKNGRPFAFLVRKQRK